MRDPSLQELLNDAIDSALLDVHTALPGRIQKYYSDTQTADIELGLKRILPVDIDDTDADEGYGTETLPILPNVPVARFKAGGHFLQFAPDKGDYGMVIFSEASMDQWRKKGGVTSPTEVGRHELSSGVFYPTMGPDSAKVTDTVSSGAAFGKEGGAQLRSNGDEMEVTSDGASSAEDYVAMSSDLDDWIAKVDTVFNTLDTGGDPPGSPVFPGAEKLKAHWLKYIPTALRPTASKNLKADKKVYIPIP